MNLEMLDRLGALERGASEGPWYVRRLDDEMCMGAIVVSTVPDTGKNESMRGAGGRAAKSSPPARFSRRPMSFQQTIATRKTQR